MVIKKNSHEKCDGHMNCLSNEKDFETRSRNKQNFNYDSSNIILNILVIYF